MQNKIVQYQDLGLIDYQQAWDFQEQLFEKIIAQKVINRQSEKDNLPLQLTPNHLLLVEHPHVYTLGKSGHEENLLASEELLKSIKATYYKTNRGGDITYHGPGQLVGYPILNLDYFFHDIHLYLRTLEEVIIKILADYGLKSERSSGETGVWLDVGKPYARKICAMGVRASRWVTMHGFALNVNTDMRYFEYIIPCGIKDKQVTSLQRELQREIPIQEVKTKLMQYFAETFDVEFEF